MQVQTVPVFFPIILLPFGFLLYILTADPVSFARFLRKRISSSGNELSFSASLQALHLNK